MTSVSVGKVILKQLGGNRFVFMTGARNFLADANSLYFWVGRNSKNVNRCKVTLNGFDTYDVEYLSVRGPKVTVKAESKGLYADQLRADFTANTGLETSL